MIKNVECDQILSWELIKHLYNIQGAKYQPKTAKKMLLSKPNSELLKKRDNKNFPNSEWFIKF